MDTASPSVTLRFAQALHQAATRLGATLPVLSGSSARVSLDDQDQLWEQLCQALADPLAGVRLGLELRVGHLDLTGLLLMSCEHYGESLEALLDFYPIIGEGGDFQLHRQGDQVQLEYQAHYQVRTAERVEAVMAALIHLSRWNSGGSFRPLALQFRHAALADVGRYQALLGCPVEFSAATNRLLFAADCLDLPLVQANPAMRDHLQQLAQQQLQQLGSDSLAQRVALLVRRQPRWGKERIAEAFAISGRHLVRRLAEEGLTFRQIRDNELLRAARDLLGRDALRIADIAAELGFSDESAFAKAFRRWQGCSPAQYRAVVRAADSSD